MFPTLRGVAVQILTGPTEARRRTASRSFGLGSDKGWNLGLRVAIADVVFDPQEFDRNSSMAS
jgi:hypothetical protein